MISCSPLPSLSCDGGGLGEYAAALRGAHLTLGGSVIQECCSIWAAVIRRLGSCRSIADCWAATGHIATRYSHLRHRTRGVAEAKQAERSQSTSYDFKQIVADAPPTGTTTGTAWRQSLFFLQLGSEEQQASRMQHVPPASWRRRTRGPTSPLGSRAASQASHAYESWLSAGSMDIAFARAGAGDWTCSRWQFHGLACNGAL